MAPAKIRGAVNQLFQLSTCLGVLIANFVNYATDKIHPWGWRLSLGIATIPAVLMFVGGLFLPETPNSLVEQGNVCFRVCISFLNFVLSREAVSFYKYHIS